MKIAAVAGRAKPADWRIFCTWHDGHFQTRAFAQTHARVVHERLCGSHARSLEAESATHVKAGQLLEELKTARQNKRPSIRQVPP